MIKKYNQFVKGKVNEELDYELETPVRTLPSFGGTKQSPTVEPGTIEKPSTTPQKPSPFRRDKPSTEPGTKAEFMGEEEEVAADKYEMALSSLASAAGVEFNPGDKSVMINGKEVTFPAETEKYHVNGVKKGFSTLEEVLAYFEDGVSPVDRTEVRDEMTSIKDESMIDRGEQFESVSYKSKRFKK